MSKHATLERRRDFLEYVKYNRQSLVTGPPGIVCFFVFLKILSQQQLTYYDGHCVVVLPAGGATTPAAMWTAVSSSCGARAFFTWRATATFLW